jgi:hypothetical protein
VQQAGNSKGEVLPAGPMTFFSPDDAVDFEFAVGPTVAPTMTIRIGARTLVARRER